MTTKRVGFAFLLFLAAVTRADFNFMVQGRLSDGTGNPIGVRTSVEWHLFRGGDPTVADGTPVYRESGFITPVNALGVFSYELGSGTAMDSPLDVSAYTGPEPIYALLVVGGSPLLPKLRVTPVPRSHVAAVAESVQSDGVDTPALKDGAVTGPKIAAGAISGTHLNTAAQLNVDRIGLGGAPATSLDLGAKTDAVRLPLGTIAQRPAAPAHGDTRYNTETNAVESYVNGSWQSLSTNAGTVTSVTASTPLASSGGTTPALSIAQADTATGGYLSSADWNTFNDKLNPALTAGQLFVGNDSNIAVGSPLSGDATLSSAGALTLASTGTAGTYTKVTTDAKGRVVSGVALDAADIPNLDAGKITSGTIDPARIPAGTDSGKLPLAGGTMTGAIDMGGNNITNGGTVAASTITVGGSNVLAASSALTSGSVLFANGAASAGQDNGNLFWDNTNKRLGVGTASPAKVLDLINSSGGTFQVQDGTTTFNLITNSAGVFMRFGAVWDPSQYWVLAANGGTNNIDTRTRDLRLYSASDANGVTYKAASGNVGIGTTSPTAALHLKAGTAAANTAPLKFTAGTNLTTPEAGAVEFDGTDLYFSTDTATRKTFAFQGSAGTLSGLTSGSVLFATSTASAGQDNSNLFGTTPTNGWG
ncbi:MAG: hypothetical protein IPN90_12165 [Elusimicrobia bacterium]|nr:hypothetical protein [Elusimicrobiota bacterium]